MAICAKCGKQLPEGAEVCPYCGSPAGQAVEYDIDSHMESALGEMMQLRTPLLDFVKKVLCLPAKLALHPIAITSLIQVGMPYLFSLDLEHLQEIADFYIPVLGLGLTANGTVGVIRHLEKEAVESPVRKKLLKIFQDEGLYIHSYSRTGSFPDYLINHSHPAHDYNGTGGGDYIALHYRGYAISCCNIVLTQPRTPAPGSNVSMTETDTTETYIDQYKEDDREAAKEFSINEGQDVVYYGSAFIFTPGPDLVGNVRLEAADPVDYLRNLKSMDETDILTNPERARDKDEFFNYNHRICTDNKGDEVLTERIFTQRVKDMVLQLELRMRAPVGIYADKNLVCLTIQEKAFDFDSIHSAFGSNVTVNLENTLIEKISHFRMILDIMLGAEGNEYTELFGRVADQRKSVYAPLLDPIHPRMVPNDAEIAAYVDDLAGYSLDVYRFFLRYSRNYQKECRFLYSISERFLTMLYSFEEETQLFALLTGQEGKSLSDSITTIVTDHFRDMWNAPGKHSVKKITHTKDGDEEGIQIDISIYPPVREWEYQKGTERLVTLMGQELDDRFNRFYKILHDDENRKQFLDLFSEKLNMVYVLKYDVEHIYTITMTLLDNDHYGFTLDALQDFYTWYVGLLESNASINGLKFTL